jgi:cytochrome oxidase assembly protein ShyY1
MRLKLLSISFKFKGLIVLIVTIACMALTAALGIWQWSRAQHKWALEESVEQMRTLPALTQEAYLALSDPLQALHRRVMLQGTWMPEETLFLDNRPMNSQAGFWVITPFKLNASESVLVQRGWIPRNAYDRTQLPPFETPLGEESIEVRISEGPSQMFDLGEPQQEGFKSIEDARSLHIRQNVEIHAFAKERGLKLMGHVIQIGSNSQGLLRDWAVPASTAYKNVGYTVQWFAMSLMMAALYIWYQIIQPKRDAKRHPPKNT